mmetsp:Transcript_15574/g.52417  ORF Transcript_15574/g.52417 Transcript_15574/m.52417 type:complete len:259 (+) Transcript_15574:231-1007(+)
MGRDQVLHASTWRLRCAGCSHDFCGRCDATPYHLGATCEEHTAPKCDLCGEAPCLRGGGGAGAASVSVSTMLSELAASGLSRSHVERRELERAYDRLRGSCGGAECLAALREACTRRLPCGHWCGGVEGEGACLGCVVLGCGGGADADCVICQEPLQRSPAVQYSCGHRCHAKCARELLSRGCPGPELTFSHLGCPLCGVAGELPLRNPPLAAAAERWVALWAATRRCARAQLRAAPAEERAKVEPGGEYDGRPVEGL